MKKSVKTLVLITITLSFLNLSFGQLKLPVRNGVGNDIRKVIEDYPGRFINLMGEVISDNEQYTNYQCNFKVNGAEECFITRYASQKEICSWQATMLTTESFEKAKQKFKSLYSQLNNLAVNISGNRNVRLRGVYESPQESRSFCSILFSIDPEFEKTSKLKAELTIQFHAPMEWKVKILVYDREREDDERGKTIDE